MLQSNDFDFNYQHIHFYLENSGGQTINTHIAKIWLTGTTYNLQLELQTGIGNR